MQKEDIGRRSHWIMRAMEWDDTRARYPNIWHEGMPRHILAFDRVASRLRLGDLIAVYYPTSSRHPERSDRFLGIARITGVRRADPPGHAWIDLESAHRFERPLDLGSAPRRVFMCCDAGWPEPDVSMFRRVFAAAVAAGWAPSEEEGDAPPASAASVETSGGPAAATAPTPPAAPRAATAPPPPEPQIDLTGARLFAGADYSGDMRDPRHKTWLSVVALVENRLKVVRLEATGRHGLQAYLRDPDRALMNAEAIGLDFPFGLPQGFAESILGCGFPEEGWWALARKLEQMSRPDFLVKLQDYREAEGAVKRFTDEQSSTLSPLHRTDPDLGSRTFHGIRMIAEDRSRYAIRPFETAQGKLLLEVYPRGVVRRLGLADEESGPQKRERILAALNASPDWPLDVGGMQYRRCQESSDALNAVLAARCAAVAVLTGETDRSAEQLAPEQGARVRREGWIYGFGEVDVPEAVASE